MDDEQYSDLDRDLEEDIERDRGVFTPADREFLTSLTQTDSTAATRRLRIRNRVKNSILDGDFLLYLDSRDRELVVENLQDEYSHAGLSTPLRGHLAFLRKLYGDFNFDFQNAVEELIRDQEENQFLKQGRLVDVEVDITAEVVDESEISELSDRFWNEHSLTDDELSALANNPNADISLADAVVYHHRSLAGFVDMPRSGQPWERSADAERQEEIRQSLTELLSAKDIHTVDEVRRLRRYDANLNDLLQELREVAEPLKPDEPPPSASDYEPRSWLDRHFSPPDVDSSEHQWNPTQDDQFHRIIALREAGFEIGVDIFQNILIRNAIEMNYDVGTRLRVALSTPTRRDEPNPTNPEVWPRVKEKSDFDRSQHEIDDLSEDLLALCGYVIDEWETRLNQDAIPVDDELVEEYEEALTELKVVMNNNDGT